MRLIRAIRQRIHPEARRAALGPRLIACALAVPAFLAVGSAALAGDLDKVVLFNIKAQTLDEALLQFGAQAHVQLSFDPSSHLSGSQKETLIGKYTGRDALRRLLRGTALYFVERGNTISIVADSVSPPRDPTRVDPPDEPAGEATSNGGKTQTGKAHPAGGSTPNEVLQEITVTGTHIREAPLSAPVITATSDDIQRSGYTTIGDFIGSLPENFGSASPQTIIGSPPNANQSPSGASAPNLFGLGAQSTLTLVDGQRLAEDSITGASDVSLIPLAVIDHIDVLTGGASAIYGSDAVAGVVNIVLKHDFNGIKTTLLGGGTADGGATERSVNQMLGKSWDTGGAILDYEFDRQDPIQASERESTSSAAPPTTPFPGTSRNSFFVSGHQTSDDISLFADGLYTDRILRGAFSSGAAYPAESEEIGVHQYAASGGLNVALPAEWQFSTVGDFSEQRTIQEFTLLPGGATPSISYEGQTKSIETSGNGLIATLPSGSVRGAVGAGYRVETYNDESEGVSALDGERRNIKYAYGELSVPLIPESETMWRQALGLDMSGRLERYSDFGDEFVPKIGLVYVPEQTVTVRGTWGKAFRAPSLFELFDERGLLYYPLPDPLSSTGVSNVLETTGGNPALGPETARTWTLGGDYHSRTPDGLSGSITYFDIAYRSVIGRLASPYTALTDPLNAPFVIRAPSESYVQSVVNSADYFVDLVGTPLNPANVPALVTFTYVNIASEDVSGGNVVLKYHKTTGLGQIEPFLNFSVLDLRQKLVPGAPEVEINGRVFEPPKDRGRGGISWLRDHLEITGTLNYSGPEINTYQAGLPRVGSWTTVDFNATFQQERMTSFGVPAISLSVENAFNRAPPFVEFDRNVPGLHYDPLNANVLGRVIRLSASWVFE